MQPIGVMRCAAERQNASFGDGRQIVRDGIEAIELVGVD